MLMSAIPCSGVGVRVRLDLGGDVRGALLRHLLPSPVPRLADPLSRQAHHRCRLGSLALAHAAHRHAQQAQAAQGFR